jgi:hypothetical protein
LIHDLELLDALSNLPVSNYEGRVFRVTTRLGDPVAFSQSGGRWAIDAEKEGGCPILYTSKTKEGAIAEVASCLNLLTPVPRRSLKLNQIEVSLDKTLQRTVADFPNLGIDREQYVRRNYSQTQKVGAAINLLELDGLIAPSARWQCDNLMIYGHRHGIDEKLEIVDEQEIPYAEWIEFADSGQWF